MNNRKVLIFEINYDLLLAQKLLLWKTSLIQKKIHSKIKSIPKLIIKYKRCYEHKENEILCIDVFIEDVFFAKIKIIKHFIVTYNILTSIHY